MPESPRVFISYVQENREIVALLVDELKRRGVNAWWDRDSLLPGMFWQDEIRRGIRKGDFFIACFSNEYLERDRTFMNEELAIAIEEIRLRGDSAWFIPVVLSGDVPDRSIGGARTLRDIHFVRLTTDEWTRSVESLCRVMAVDENRIRQPSAVSDAIAQEREWQDTHNSAQMHRIVGFGQAASDMVALEAGLWRVTFLHQGDGHFGVWLLNEYGDRVELLANSSGLFHGTKLVRIPDHGSYLCDISAAGKWELVISRPMQLQSLSVLQGRSQAGTDLITLAGGLRIFSLKHEGAGHFSVWLLDHDGERVALLANTSGVFSGSKAVKLTSGAYALDISADGQWEIAWR